MSKCANRCPDITPDAVDQARRKLLAGAAAVSTLALAPGVSLLAATPAAARPMGQAASPNKRWGILIDVSKCPDGCTQCVSACKTENGWEGKGRAGTQPEWIRNVSVKDKNTGATKSVPVMCQHCSEPPCVDVCPTGASFKRVDGIVLVDKHICIGCRYCMMACPYAARSFIHEDITDQKLHAPRGKGTVESCTMCVHRVDAGKIPACVEACSTTENRSMIFGDLNDPNSEIAKAVGRQLVTRLRANLGVDPGVLYSGL